MELIEKRFTEITKKHCKNLFNNILVYTDKNLKFEIIHE